MEVNSSEITMPQGETAPITVKKPKRVLFFSDGTLEEYSDSEDDQAAPVQSHDEVDTSSMGWGPWLKHKAVKTGTTTLGVCDYVGETLASILGITTPKYHFELEEYKKREKEQKEEAENYKGWLNPTSERDVKKSVATEQPSTAAVTAV